jgi:hypothetical protein
MTNNVVQRIWGVFDPVLNILKGVTTSGESPYYSVLAGIQVVGNFAAARQVLEIGNTAIIALGATTPADGGGGTYALIASDTTSGSWFIGTISGTVLNVLSVFNGTVAVGQSINVSTTDVTVGTIVSFGTGSGGTGTYNLSAPASVSTATIMTGDLPPNLLVGFDGGRWHLAVPFLPSFATNFLPTSTLTYNIGSPTFQWLNIYAQGLTLSGNAAVSGNVSAVGGTFSGNISAVNATFTGSTNISALGASLVPGTTNVYALGSVTNAYSQLYLGANASPAYQASSGNIGYYAPTAAEIAYFGSYAAAIAAIPDPWSQPYTLVRYGIDITGSVDGTTILQTCCNVAAQANHAQVTVGVPGAILKIGSTWSIDTNKTGFDGQGCFINASSFISGNWLTPVQSASDVNQRPLLNSAHPIRNFTVQGPGRQVAAACAVYLNDTNAAPTIAGMIFQAIGFQDWGQDVIFNNGAFCNLFDGCTFAVTVAGSTGPATTYSISQPAASNNAERNTFIGCGWYNKTYLIQSLSTNSGDLYIIGCSLDGASTAISCIGSSYIYLTNCHVESGSGSVDLANWIYVSGNNAGVFCDNCQFVIDASKSLLDLFWSDASCLNFGVQLTDCTIATGAITMTTRLIGGTGMVVVHNLRQLNGSPHPAVAQSNSVLAYGGFEQAAYANDWTFSGTTPPSRSTAQAHAWGAAYSGATGYVVGNYVSSGGNYYYCIAPTTGNAPPNATYWTLFEAVGTYSLSFPASSTNTPQAVATRPCLPGQYVQGDFWYMVPAITGTGGTFYCEVDYLDEAGASITGANVVLAVTANVAAFTRIGFKFQVPAPAGTVSAKLLFEIFGTTSGAPIAYVDDLVFNIV